MNTKSENTTEKVEKGKPPLPVNPANLSVSHASQWLGIGQTKMWALIRDGEVKAVRLGSRTLIPIVELHRFQSQLLNEAAA